MTNANGEHGERGDRGEHGDRRERIVPFTTEDGKQLNLINVRGEREPTREPVILVHGAGVRGNIFRAPVEFSDLLRREFVVEFITELLEHFALLFNRKSVDLFQNLCRAHGIKFNASVHSRKQAFCEKILLTVFQS